MGAGDKKGKESATSALDQRKVDEGGAAKVIQAGGVNQENQGGQRMEGGGDERGSSSRSNPEGEEEEFEDLYGPDPDLEDQFAGMKLHGEEEEDLDFSGEVDELISEVRWLGLFRVHTTRPFSHSALLNQMRNAWSAAQGVTFSIKGPNLFLVQCHCLGDWKRVMEGGPWLFRRAAVVIQEYDGYTDVTEYKLTKIPVWARIKGLPDGLTRKKELAEKVAAKVGEPPFTVVVNEGRINPASTLRARVFLDVHKPLVRFVPITLKGSKKYKVFYEKLPDFCFACGLMGHVAEECGDGVHDPKSFEWGDWLMWEPEPLVDLPMGGRGRGDGGGRGRNGGRGDRGGRFGRGGGDGSGRGMMGGGRRQEEGEYEGMEYTTAPNIDRSNNVRKRLISPDGTVNVRGQALSNLAGKVAGTVMLLENGTATGLEATTSTPGKDPVVKRRRQEGEVETEEMDTTHEAASREEDRRAQ